MWGWNWQPQDQEVPAVLTKQPGAPVDKHFIYTTATIPWASYYYFQFIGITNKKTQKNWGTG